MKAWWKIARRRRSRKQVYEQLLQQRLLLQQGLRAHARIVEIEERNELLKGYVELRVWVIIRLQERLLYQLSRTMVPVGKIPVAGEVVPIRLLPGDTSYILILS